MKSLIWFIGLLVGLVSLVNLIAVVSACDEAEMQTMMTGSIIGSNLSNNFGILLWIKEPLIIIVLVLLAIYLIKLIGRKEKEK